MKTVDARTRTEWLDHHECLRLLAADEIGRLAVLDGHTPIILPVNYRLDGEAVVFRTDPGTKLDRGPRAPASFEIDQFDREHRTGWSVVVVGRLEEVTPYDATHDGAGEHAPGRSVGGGRQGALDATDADPDHGTASGARSATEAVTFGRGSPAGHASQTEATSLVAPAAVRPVAGTPAVMPVL